MHQCSANDEKYVITLSIAFCFRDVISKFGFKGVHLLNILTIHESLGSKKSWFLNKLLRTVMGFKCISDFRP